MKHLSNTRLFIVLSAFLLVGNLIAGEPPSTVVTTADDVVNDSDGQISLREAIAYAGTGALGTNITFDAVVFATARTITLNSTLAISKSLSIDGAGKVILDGGTVRDGSGSIITNGVQIIKIEESNNVVLSNLTFQNGYANDNGGAIFNDGTLTVSNSTLSDNRSTSTGGAIANIRNGVLTVSNSTLSRNSSGSFGGAIYNDGTLTVSNSTLSRNSAGSDGGAILNDGTLTVSNSTLSDNRSTSTGGAIENIRNGVLTVSNSTLSGNSTEDLGGGAIWSDGVLTVSNSTLSGNSATSGGAIANEGTAYLVNNIILGNGDDQIVGDLALNEFNLTTGSMTDIFESVAAGKAVPDADGTFHIKGNGAAAWSGTKLQNNGGDLQYWNKETGSWANAGVTTTLTTDQLQVDQLGHNRTTGNTTTAGNYAVGAYSVEASIETKSLIVNTADDVVEVGQLEPSVRKIGETLF